jgi:hypothetical protein
MSADIMVGGSLLPGLAVGGAYLGSYAAQANYSERQDDDAGMSFGIVVARRGAARVGRAGGDSGVTRARAARTRSTRRGLRRSPGDRAVSLTFRQHAHGPKFAL